MEARDSSSGTVAAQTHCRVGDEQVDEDAGAMAAACGLARDAAVLFQGGRFAECVEVLNQILQKKEDDPKVLHNIAIANYFHDGCSDPRKLVDSLNKIKKKSEDLAQTSGEQMEVAANLGNNITSGCKASGDQVSSPSSASIPYADAFDTSIMTLNIATALYHLHDYAHALLVLEPLYQRLHPLDETIALQVCLLLIDITLASNDASRAADVIQHIEKSFGVGYMTNQGDIGNVSQQETPSQTLKATSAPSALTVPDASSDFCASANASEAALDGTLSEDAIEYENLLSTLHSNDQSITRSIANEMPRATTDHPFHAIDLKLKIHLHKVQLLLLTRNLKAAKREIKLIMNVARGRDSSVALLLKSQLEYARGNYRKAIKLLMTSSNRTEPGMLSMFSNNLGCIYHQLQKHHASIVLFSRALGRSPLRVERPLKLSAFPLDKSMPVLYNCGLQYLTCGKPLIAAHCFREVSRIFYNRPLLWLRFAECSLLALEKGQLKHNQTFSGKEQVKLHVIGSGKWRQLAVDMNHRYKDAYSTSESGNDDGYMITIPFARQCLLNALYLLDRFGQKYPRVNSLMSTSEVDLDLTLTSGLRNSNHSTQTGQMKLSNAPLISASASANGDSRESKGSTGSNTTIQSSVSAYGEMCRKENHMIRQAALADLAFVELCLQNHLRALSVAKALQQLPGCSRAYRFLGCVYAAEALCCLNRSREAAEHLSIYFSDGSTVDLPYSEDDRQMWILEKIGDVEDTNGSVTGKTTASEELKSRMFVRPEEARGVLYVNLAAVSAMQGDLEMAKLFVSEALSALPNNPQALMAAVYLDLRLGKTSDALIKLRQCSRAKFFPTEITLSSS